MSKELFKEAVDHMENFKEIKENLVLHCAFCSKSIGNTKWKKRHQHINIDQEPKRRYFCSQQCKLKWIFEKA